MKLELLQTRSGCRIYNAQMLHRRGECDASAAEGKQGAAAAPRLAGTEALPVEVQPQLRNSSSTVAAAAAAAAAPRERRFDRLTRWGR